MILMSSILIAAGSLFILIAAIGILRMPDLLMRMHAATKAGTLGVGMNLLGAACYFKQLSVSIEALLTIIFIVISAPVASHLIAKASYSKKIKLYDKTIIDELKIYRENIKINNNQQRHID